jgi:hypothetical protein
MRTNELPPEEPSMETSQRELSADPAIDLTVDGNAVAGVLASIFGVDVTANPGECAHCGTVSLIGGLRAYVRGPGIVLRCPACSGVVIRIVETPRGRRLDVRGAAYLVIGAER